MNDIALVVAHHLPTLDFLESWRLDIIRNDVKVVIVEDKPTRQTTVPNWLNDYEIYTHEDIDKDLGKDSWIIPKGTSAIRSYGLYKAWLEKPDMIVTLDNDCYSEDENFSYLFEGHKRNLEKNTTLDWVGSSSLISRGFPYLIRDKATTMVSHGLWSNVPDLDAAQMLLNHTFRTPPAEEVITIPRYNFYPECSMNLAFRNDATPLLYHGLFGEKYGFDQFDDIWAGVLSKKVLDHLGYAVKSGRPSVRHNKQSDVFTNFRKQAGGLEMNEYLWQAVKEVTLTKDNMIDCYKELIIKLPDTIKGDTTGWLKRFKKAALIWIDLFKV